MDPMFSSVVMYDGFTALETSPPEELYIETSSRLCGGYYFSCSIAALICHTAFSGQKKFLSTCRCTFPSILWIFVVHS